MLFYFFVSIDSKTLSWLSQETSIYEISSVLIIAWRNIFSSYLCLFIYDCFTNFFSASSKIWSSTYHTFICYNSYSEIICSNSMILLEHYFRSHVSWCSTILCTVFRRPFSCNSKIGQPQISICIKNKIFWLDISMYDSLLVDVF